MTGCYGKVVPGASVGATFRNYGWWVPLRRTALALSWQVEWLPLTQEAIVQTAASLPE